MKSLPPLPLFDQSPFSMVLYDLTGRPLYVNAAFQRLFAMRLEDAPADYSVLRDPELGRQGALPLVERAFKGEAVRVGPIHYDTPAAHGVGKATWTYGYFWPLEVDGERYIALQHVDLTETVETERALRLANQRYSALVAATSQVVWSTDARGLIEDMPAWRELTGQTLEEVRGEGWTNALHPDDRAPARERWWRAYESRVKYESEYRLRMRDGRYRWMRARAVPVLDDGRNIIEWVGTLEDINDDRLSEERKQFLHSATLLLNQSLEWEPTLRALARHCVPMLADYASVDLVQADGEIRRVETAHSDPARESLVRELWARYPYRRDEPYGVPAVLRTGTPQFVPEFPWEMVEAFARDSSHLEMLRTLGPRSYICVPLAARGHTFGALSLVFSDSGRRYTPVELELARELAARASAAVDNARLYQEAGGANKAKAEFLAMMSHELRTPLNAISGYAELLEMGIHGPLTDEQRQDVARIQRNQRHLLALVNDVLNFARVEAGNVHYDIRCVELAPILADAESAIRPQLRARGLAYLERLAAGRLFVIADAEKVLQILLNLLSNAVKFTEAGGNVTLSTEADQETIRIAVTDTGRGIPPDKLAVIFEPFVQIDRGLTRSMEGAGLGLSISANLAKEMRGQLSVASSEGQGTTFTLVLPRGHPDSASAS
jgi:PAS domain S-box-containing protein